MLRTRMFQTPLCRLCLTEEDGALVALEFVPHNAGLGGTECDEALAGGQAAPSSPLLEEAAKQLEDYFAGTRRCFDLPLRPQGTPFMLRVWEALRGIPYGTTVCYADIAARIGQPAACRAVGMANNRNPLPIVIPCHRVIGRDGRLVGYDGGLHVKRFLLELEGVALAKA